MTPLNRTQGRASFHESTLVAVSRRGDALSLDLDDVLIDATRVPASVTIQGVRSILREGAPVETISMEQEDGEVLSLRQESDQVLLVVQWNDFCNKREAVVTYKLLGARMMLRFPDGREI